MAKLAELGRLDCAATRASGREYVPRHVRGLRWARWCEPPGFAAGVPPAGSAQAAGLRFQRRVWRAWGGELSPWIAFEDSAGPGFASPDIVLRTPQALVVVECKLRRTPIADAQLRHLYMPLLEALAGEAPAGVAVCRWWQGPPATLLRSVAEAERGSIGYMLF